MICHIKQQLYHFFQQYTVSNAALYIVHRDLPHKAATLPDSLATCAKVSNLAKLLAKLVIATLFLILLTISTKLFLRVSSEPECPLTQALVESLTIAKTPSLPNFSFNISHQFTDLLVILFLF